MRFLFLRNFLESFSKFDILSSELQKKGHICDVLFTSEYAREQSRAKVNQYSNVYVYKRSKKLINLDHSNYKDFDSLEKVCLIPVIDRITHLNLDYSIENAKVDFKYVYCFLHSHFSQNSYDAVIFEQETDVFSLLARNFSEIFGFKYITFAIGASMINGYTEIYTQSWWEVGSSIPNFSSNNKQKNKGKEIYNTLLDRVLYKENPNSAYQDQTTRSIRINFFMALLELMLKWPLLYIQKLSLTKNDYDPFHGSLILWNIRCRLTKLYRSIRWPIYSIIFQRRSEIPKENYFILPLQFRPEASTSVIGSKYLDEIKLIDNILSHTPTESKLIVKDHPQAAGFRSLYFYFRLLFRSRVITVLEHGDLSKLIKRSSGVFFNTSKFGLEASLLNNNVFCLGSPVYSSFPGIHNIHDIENTGSILRKRKPKINSELSEDRVEWLSKYSNIIVEDDNLKSQVNRIISLASE